jgi:penicillin-binding protein 1A
MIPTYSWKSRPSRLQVANPGDIIMATPAPGAKATLHLEEIPNVQGALICMNPRTGRVLAMVGGWSHDISPFNRVTQAERQPGSGIKPFVYLTAMEQDLQPDAPVLDAPFVQQMPDGTVYRPENYEENFQGPVPIYHALEQSLNLATLHLAQQVGLDEIAMNFMVFVAPGVGAENSGPIGRCIFDECRIVDIAKQNSKRRKCRRVGANERR